MKSAFGFRSETPHQSATVMPSVYSPFVSISTLIWRPVKRSGRISQAMTQNPKMKVLVQSGYFDLACPYGTVDYALQHLDVAPHAQHARDQDGVGPGRAQRSLGVGFALGAILAGSALSALVAPPAFRPTTRPALSITGDPEDPPEVPDAACR